MPNDERVLISDLLSIPDVAKMNGVTRQAVYLWADPKVGRRTRRGHRTFLSVRTVAGCYRVIHRPELERFLAETA